MKPPFKQRPPRLPRIFSPADAIYFITANTHGRQPCLASSRIHEAFVEFCRGAPDFDVVVGRYVLMPDHLHLFVAPGLTMRLGHWMKALKRSLNPAIEACGWHPFQHPQQKLKSFWQPGFFDHKLRHDESYAQKWDYVRHNPVRAGLVAEPELWPHQGEIHPLRLAD